MGDVDEEDEDVDSDGVILTSVEVRMGLDDVDPGLVFELLPSNKFPKAGTVALVIHIIIYCSSLFFLLEWLPNNAL